MEALRYTLLTDGSSDMALMPLIDWLLQQHLPDLLIQPQFARGLGMVGHTLDSRLSAALLRYPCDLLFVHRDAEGPSTKLRLQEIAQAMSHFDQAYVPIVPVRMSEAWLLSDSLAIRKAAGNRNGTGELELPGKERWEHLRDPKQVLERALQAASEKSVRRQQRLPLSRQRLQVTEYTGDFSRLRGLPSFDFFESQLVEKLKDI